MKDAILNIGFVAACIVVLYILWLNGIAFCSPLNAHC